ncbi:MAG: class I SAM-dependent methyltransferase [Deltaproteobacteria bacterium]|nr:class I SAM-dependent methyltransferase [Deltaproteobacteria bacterium]MBW2533398.1 class I SAM-dependent methyltransferase [Deltaproteobacteria bacterium]
MRASDPSRVSPTAHYTGYVWVRHGLSPAGLGTGFGRLMFHGLRPLARVASLGTGGVILETFLLQRHRIIDRCLERAIEGGRIGQVVEIAGGLSGRGLRFAERFADQGLVYVEGDLPGMARRKQRMLDALGPRRPGHHVIGVDALRDDGPLALGAAAGPLLDPSRGTALVTEGLLNYFDRPSVLDMWRRFARFLQDFPAGQYLTDVHLRDAVHARVVPRVFLAALGVFAAGSMHLHFATEEELAEACRSAGFGAPEVHRPEALAAELGLSRSRGPDHVRVLECWCCRDGGGRLRR